MGYFPSPTGIDPLDAPLTVNTALSFDTGNPTTDMMAKLIVNFADIKYDQVTTISMDVGVTEPDNDISAPVAANLVPVFKPTYSPADVYVVGILLTCEFGEMAIYMATDVTSDDYFNPPDITGVIPIPLIKDGWFLYLNDHEYEEADTWQGESDQQIFIGEILAATFLPSRITGYIFLKNRVV
jgi:hypothetical protein